MSARHLVLAAAAALVLGLGLYLFREVRATPVATEAPVAGAKHPRAPMPTPAGEVGADDDRGGSQPTKGPISDAYVLPERYQRTGSTTDAGHVQITGELPAGGAVQDHRADGAFSEAMSEANKAYDRGDFEDAKGIAQKVLAKNPGNVRMLRILVSASCIDGDNDTAQNNFQLLPVADREQMKQRCARYGVTFADKPGIK